MMITCVIASVSNGILLALSPVQRWQSAGRFDSNWITESWFITTALVVMTFLTLLLLISLLYRSVQEKKTANILLAKNAEKRGLSIGEFKTLLDIANSSGLSYKAAVFTMEDAFERGVNRLLKSFTKGAAPAQVERLKSRINFLREKLGFQNPILP